MKVIHYVLGGAKPNPGTGVGKVVHHLAKELRKRNIESEIWGSREPNFEYGDTSNLGYGVKYFKSNRMPVKMDGLKIDPRLTSEIVKLNPESTIFHFHSVFIPEYYPICNKLKKIGIPWVVSPHSGYNTQVLNRHNWIKHMYAKFIESSITRGAKFLVACGEVESEELAYFEPETPCVLIPNGQDFDEISFIDNDPMKPKERPLFGFCGRLAIEHKGLDIFFNGFTDYKRNGGKGSAWLIGYGEDENKLKSMSMALGVDECVHFKGPKFGAEKYTYIKSLDVFFHTSRWEGMPMSLIEASSLGKPLLVSKETSFGSYVEKYNSGIVIQENSPKCVADSLHLFDSVYESTNFKKMENNSKKMARQEFEWSSIVSQLIDEVYIPSLNTTLTL